MNGSSLIGSLGQFKTLLSLGVLFVLWWLETWIPLFREGRDGRTRLQHGGRNLVIAGVNIAVTGLMFSSAMAFVTNWAEARQIGLLRWMPLSAEMRALSAILLMDAWMYLWHRANHMLPVLWRFHRMHHSDPLMDVTTATRFHPGEIILSSLLRLAVVPLLGLSLWHLALYEVILLPIIQLHHSNMRLPNALDTAYRLLLVSPNMHRVHHSRFQPETDSNFSSIFSFWDRLGGSFRLRDNPATIELGLWGYEDRQWQTLTGMLKTPFGEKAEGGRRKAEKEMRSAEF